MRDIMQVEYTFWKKCIRGKREKICIGTSETQDVIEHCTGGKEKKTNEHGINDWFFFK